MKVRRWIVRMIILDLLTLGLLFGTGRRTAESRDWGSRRVSTAADSRRVSTVADSEPEKDVKKAALTFDDGPHPRYTVQLLDGLKERGVKATFFVTGANAAKYPELIRRMQEEGHLIGNHTYHHVQLTQTNEEQFRREIISTNEVIAGITGRTPEYIRPPYGSWNKKYEKELDMLPVLWTVDPRDWCADGADCIVESILEQVGENDIILMHDQYSASVAAALRLADALQERGYELVTVDELLLD